MKIPPFHRKGKEGDLMHWKFRHKVHTLPSFMALLEGWALLGLAGLCSRIVVLKPERFGGSGMRNQEKRFQRRAGGVKLNNWRRKCVCVSLPHPRLVLCQSQESVRAPKGRRKD